MQFILDGITISIIILGFVLTNLHIRRLDKIQNKYIIEAEKMRIDRIDDNEYNHTMDQYLKDIDQFDAHIRLYPHMGASTEYTVRKQKLYDQFIRTSKALDRSPRITTYQQNILSNNIRVMRERFNTDSL